MYSPAAAMVETHSGGSGSRDNMPKDGNDHANTSSGRMASNSKVNSASTSTITHTNESSEDDLRKVKTTSKISEISTETLYKTPPGMNKKNRKDY